MDLSYDRCLHRLRSAKNAGGFDGQGKPVVLRILLTMALHRLQDCDRFQRKSGSICARNTGDWCVVACSAALCCADLHVPVQLMICISMGHNANSEPLCMAQLCAAPAQACRTSTTSRSGKGGSAVDVRSHLILYAVVSTMRHCDICHGRLNSPPFVL